MLFNIDSDLTSLSLVLGVCADGVVLGVLHASSLPGATTREELPPDSLGESQSGLGKYRFVIQRTLCLLTLLQSPSSSILWLRRRSTKVCVNSITLAPPSTVCLLFTDTDAVAVGLEKDKLQASPVT